MKKFRFTKLAGKEKEIKRLRKKGFSIYKISKIFGVSSSAISYQLFSKKKKRKIIEKVKKYNKKHRKKSDVAYITAYMKERYQKSPEFRKRMIGYVIKSEKKRIKKRKKEGKCFECNKKLKGKDKNYFRCEKCRKKARLN